MTFYNPTTNEICFYTETDVVKELELDPKSARKTLAYLKKRHPEHFEFINIGRVDGYKRVICMTSTGLAEFLAYLNKNGHVNNSDDACRRFTDIITSMAGRGGSMD
jgi:hypothetical protein